MEDTAGQFQFMYCSSITSPEHNPQVTGFGNNESRITVQPDDINPMEFVIKEEIIEQYVLKVEDLEVDNTEVTGSGNDEISSTVQTNQINPLEFVIKEEIEEKYVLKVEDFEVDNSEVSGSGNNESRSTVQPDEINPLEYVIKEEIKEQYVLKVEDFEVDNTECTGSGNVEISSPVQTNQINPLEFVIKEEIEEKYVLKVENFEVDNSEITGSGNNESRSTVHPDEIKPLEYVIKEEIVEQYVLKVEDFEVDNTEVTGSGNVESSSTVQGGENNPLEFVIKEELEEKYVLKVEDLKVDNTECTGSGNYKSSSTVQGGENNPLEFVIKEELEEKYVLKVEDFEVDNTEVTGSGNDTSRSTVQPDEINSLEYVIKEEVEEQYILKVEDFEVDNTEVTEPKKPVSILWNQDAKKPKLIQGMTLDKRGEAPPPLATCVGGDIGKLDILEFKFGPVGEPAPGPVFVCPRCPTFKVKTRQDMREHLFKDLEYKPLTCTICKIAGTQKAKLTRHIFKSHGIGKDKVASYIKTTTNKDVENWVDKVLSTQHALMKDLPKLPDETVGSIIPSKKRRRSSVGGKMKDQRSSVAIASAEDEAANVINPLPALADDAPPTSTGTSGHPDSSASRESTSSLSGGSGEGMVSGSEKKRRDKCPSRHRFRCDYCKLTAKYKNSVASHIKKMHPTMPSKITPLTKPPIDDKTDAYNCEYCNCTALDFSNLKYHWALTHKLRNLDFMYNRSNIYSEVDYECFYCKKRSVVGSLAEHCALVHPELRFLVVSITVPKYKCTHCKLVFSSVEVLKRHFAIDHPLQEFCYIVGHTQKPTPPQRESGSPKKVNHPSPRPTPRILGKHKQSLYNNRRKKLNLNTLMVSISSHGKNIKLPVEILQQLVNFDVKLSLEQKTLQQT